MSKNNKQQHAASILKQLKEVPGLFSCLMEHQVANTKTQFKWDGPKIPPEVWEQILAFFQWTYDTSKSESQVRLYINPKLKTWAAWAYPQEAQTGMSARELTDQWPEDQVGKFKGEDG